MPLPQDKVFLGMSRPAMLGGTHVAAVVANTMVTLYAFVLTDSLWTLAFAIPVHGVCAAISRYDAHAFRLIALKQRGLFESLGNRPHWRAASRAPYGRRAY